MLHYQSVSVLDTLATLICVMLILGWTVILGQSSPTPNKDR